MHTIASTVTEVFAGGTLTCLHPLVVAIRMVTILPDIHEVILIDVALIVVGTNAGTSSDGTISHHRTYGNACLTREKTGTRLAFVIAKESLTAIINLDTTFFTRLFQILKYPSKLSASSSDQGLHDLQERQ